MDNNESAFCSLWAEYNKENGCAQMFLNLALGDDYFFNRINLKNCVGIRDLLQLTRNKIPQVRQNCYIHVLKSDVLTLDILRKNGLIEFGSLKIMNLQYELFGLRIDKHNVNILPVGPDNLNLWIDTFCRSFGVIDIKAEIARLSLKILKHSILIIAISQFRGLVRPLGCCALFEKRGGMGLYCLGTLPEHRDKGVATAMIKACLDISRQNGYDCIFVQTLADEGLEKFYLKLGFKQVYEKVIFVLNRRVSCQSEL
jgi:GNAT superfamily N-acetyltransferase